MKESNEDKLSTTRRLEIMTSTTSIVSTVAFMIDWYANKMDFELENAAELMAVWYALWVLLCL